VSSNGRRNTGRGGEDTSVNTSVLSSPYEYNFLLGAITKHDTTSCSSQLQKKLSSYSIEVREGSDFIRANQGHSELLGLKDDDMHGRKGISITYS
jgi:hypothetical protein